MTAGVAIGVDIGTSGVRAVLVDESCEMLAAAGVTTPPDRLADPQAWWNGAEQALAKLAASADLSWVRALAVDGTSGTVIAVDKDGAPLGPASLYNMPADPEAVARVHGAAPDDTAARGATSPLAKLLVMQDRPGIARMLHQADWIAGRMCGRFDVTDENNALKTGYDPVRRVWPAWLTALGARIDLLPDVVAPGTAIGTLRPDVARRLGLPTTTIVAAGTTDGCASFLATGAHEVGEAVTALGSTLTIKQLSDRPIFAPAYGLYSHRLGERWLVGGASNTGGAVLAAYFDPATLEALSARIDPSQPSRLDYYPLPRPGERFPIADPKLPPKLGPRPADDAAFLHGLLEGIARIEALGFHRLAELGGPALTSVRTVGGGARNAAWTAIRARVLGIPFLPARSQEAAVGAAWLALRA